MRISKAVPRGILAIAVTFALLAAVHPAVQAATLAQIRQFVGEPELTDAQVIQKTSEKLGISADEIAKEVGFVGSLPQATRHSDGNNAGGSNHRIHTIGDLRAHYGAEGTGKTDAQLIQDYAPRVGMEPDALASKLSFRIPHEDSLSDRVSEKAIGGAVLGALAVLVISLLTFGRHLLARFRRVTAGRAASALAGTQSEDAMYVQAMAELDGGTQEKALWARSVATSDGDQGRAKAHYIKLRVAQLVLAPKPPAVPSSVSAH